MIDPQFTPDVEIRLLKIEEALTDLWQMMRFVLNKEQFNRLNVIRQKEMALLETRLDTVETDITDLETKYNDLL
jgi:polyhydroxyalkanoate synthesis regulator phasin